MHLLTLNGQDHAVAPWSLLIDLVAEAIDRPLAANGTPEDGRRLGIAVALDNVVVPRSRWHDTLLEDGQAVEIVTAMQGG